jgi:hypothetical protein
MNPWIMRIIVNHLIKKNELLGERVFNFQIGPVPSTIIIRSLKIKFIFFILNSLKKTQKTTQNTLRI